MLGTGGAAGKGSWAYRLVGVGASTLSCAARRRAAVPTALGRVSLWAGREKEHRSCSWHSPGSARGAQCRPTLPTSPHRAACAKAEEVKQPLAMYQNRALHSAQPHHHPGGLTRSI